MRQSLFPTSRLNPTGRLAAVERQIVLARRELMELWRRANPADRIFAVDRLLRENILEPEVQQRLQAVQDVVRDAWVTARVARALRGAVPADARVAGLQYSLSERHRDSFLEEHHIFDALFLTAEGYLRAVPPAPNAPTFRDLWRKRENLFARIVPILPPEEEAVEEAVAS
jgi:hypothetical protein